VIDDVYTWTYIEQYGLVGEINPVTRFFFQSDLGVVWALLNVLIPLFTMALLGSFCESHSGESRSWIATVFSALFTLRTLILFYHVLYFDAMSYMLAMSVCLLLLISIRKVLLHEEAIKLASIRERLWMGWLSLSVDVAGMSWTSVQGLMQKAISDARKEFKSYLTLKRLRSPKLWLLLLIILALPVLLLKLIDLLADLLGVRVLQFWEEGLGIVTRNQAAMFLLTFISMLIVVGAIMYVLLSVFNE